MAREMDPYQTVQTLISQYMASPESFEAEEIMQIKQAADELGIKFDIPQDFGRMAKNFLFELGDTATFGFLPDELFGKQIKPDALTSSDRVAGGLGSAAGFFTTPWAAGGAAAKAATSGLGKLAAGGAKAAGRGAAGRVANTGLIGALERMGMGKVAAQKVGGFAGGALNKGAGLVPGAKGLASRGAKLLGDYVSPKFIESGVRTGTAMAAADLGNDLGDGNFMNIVNRAMGGAFLGGAAHVVGGAAQGVIPQVVEKLTGIATKTGSQQAIRVMAAAIWGNMTAPEKEQYPKEFVENFLVNTLLAYR